MQRLLVLLSVLVALLLASCESRASRDDWIKSSTAEQGVHETALSKPDSDASNKNQTASENARFWSLRTGSRIAYIYVPAIDSAKATPLVFVHGGPGAYEVSDFERGKEWYQRLAQHGFDVYLYDQIGSGLSARLANPREYTLARHVADLEAIRNIIGGPAPLPSGVVDAGRSRQFVLIGGSFGATLVANYMATYPRRVTKAVFLCPGKLDPSEWTESHPANPQITSEFLEWIEKERGASGFRRYSELNTLMQSNLQAAYAMAPDSEMDPLLDEFVDSILPTTVYDKTLMKGKHSHGMGWWSYTMTNWDANRLQTHPRSVLAADHTPVLIMRGDADYVPEEVARQYEITFPNAKFMRVAKAGHYIWLDQPDVFKSAIESFLAVDSVNSK